MSTYTILHYGRVLGTVKAASESQAIKLWMDNNGLMSNGLLQAVRS